MNAVEIEEAISSLAEQPFDAAEFPYAFLEAFGNKATTIKRLRSAASNKSDVRGVLQSDNIHNATCPIGEVTETLAVLQASPATARAKAKFILATDGERLDAEAEAGDNERRRSAANLAYGASHVSGGRLAIYARNIRLTRKSEGGIDLVFHAKNNMVYCIDDRQF